MSKAEYPVMQAVCFLRSKRIDFVPYVYAYEEHSGTAHLAGCAGKPRHQVIETIVLQGEHKKGLAMLMYGGGHISTHSPTCELDLEHIEPATIGQATKWTGYLVDGTLPLGMKTALPVYVEESIWVLDEIFISGGKRGLIMGMKPENLRMLNPQDVHVAVDA